MNEAKWIEAIVLHALSNERDSFVVVDVAGNATVLPLCPVKSAREGQMKSTLGCRSLMACESTTDWLMLVYDPEPWPHTPQNGGAARLYPYRTPLRGCVVAIRKDRCDWLSPSMMA
jgi:hypothetical protein